jgi:prepilin signal peptidase PulO-like enzyme (type II secretory pathway)
MITFIAVTAAGALSGHLWDLLLARAYRGSALQMPPTRCHNCYYPAGNLEFIPVAGILIQRNCRSCGAPLGWRSLLLTVGGALVFGAARLEFDSAGQAMVGGALASVFLALTVTDLQLRLLPDRIVLPTMGLALATSWVLPDMSLLESAAGGGAGIAFAVLLLLLSLPFGSEALGMGDAKMVVLMGFLLGPLGLAIGVFLATAAAGLVAAVLLLLRLRRFGDYIPHGPFLAMGALVALFLGDELWNWYSR